MTGLVVFLLAAAAVPPDVTVGPDALDRAPTIEAPITAVTVFSDRARVRRTARKKLAPGIHTLRLPDLPGGVDLDTLRLGSEEARVLRVEALPVERERFALEEVEKLIDRLQTLTDKLRGIDDERLVYRLELALLADLKPTPDAVEGQPLPKAEPQGWKKSLAFVHGRRDAARAVLRKLDQQRDDVAAELARVQAEVSKHDLDRHVEQRVQVLAVVEAGQAGAAELALEYMLPGASWKPVYDLHHRPTDGKVTLRTAGLVRQTTGESWDEVTIALSTAMPGERIDVPELHTRALGERREFVPAARAEFMPAEAPRFALPAAPRVGAERRARLQALKDRLAALKGLTEQDATAEKVVGVELRVGQLKDRIFRTKARQMLLRETVLAGKLDKGKRPARPRGIRGDQAEIYELSLAQTASPMPSAQVDGMLAEARNERDLIKVNCLQDKLSMLQALERMLQQTAVELEQARQRGDQEAADFQQSKLAVIQEKLVALSAEAETCAGMAAAYGGDTTLEVEESGKEYDRRSVIDFEDDLIEGEMLQPASEPMAKSAGGFFRVRSRKKKPVHQRRAQLDLGPQSQYWVLARLTDPELPAMLTGGLDYVYSCPTRLSVPSGREAIRVPLAVETYPVKTFYEAAPSLKATAYLKADVNNPRPRPILGGKVNIFTGEEFAGQGRLQTTGPGGTLSLPLGADEDIRIKRTVTPKTRTKGVFRKDDVTTYTTTIEVASYKSEPVRITVVDQVPRSGHKKIEIEELHFARRPLDKPDEDGRVRWELTVAPGKTEKIVFKYDVTRPEGWELYQ